MQALQDMIDASAYQATEANTVFSTTDATSTPLQPNLLFDHPHDIVPSYQDGGHLSTSLGEVHSFAPAGSNLSSSRPTATPDSTPDTTAHRVGGSTPFSVGADSPGSGSSKIRKRQRNTEAARRYRQRKLDRASELEEALEAMGKERDELRLKLAKAETEAGVLRGLVGK
uniref:Putative transcription factor n=1 Tax=Passalora fulva TaxID=5499 RepID=Q9HFP3_PASFU|nr:putative transcription factor [Fulvia fulva]